MRHTGFGLHITTLIITAGLAVTGNAQVMVPSPEEVTNDIPADIKKQYDEDALTWYGVYADDKAVHVQVTIIDSLQKRKLLQNGMELWIDSKGKKNKITGIMFPLSTKTNNYPGGGSRNAAGGPPPFSSNSSNNNIKNADTDIQQLINSQTEIEVKGFTFLADGKQTITQLTGLSVQLRMLHDTLVYDATIPFKLIEQPAKNIVSVGIIEKGIALPGFGGDMGGPDGDFGGPPPGDGGGGGGMMPPPADGPPGDFDMRRLFETNSIWYKLKLKK